MDPVLDLVAFVEDEWHQGNMTIVVCIYMRRYFSSVSHAHVLHGLFKIRVHGRMLCWLFEYLQDSTIFVYTTDGKSREHKLFREVPQGSVLSPILFNAVMAQLLVELS